VREGIPGFYVVTKHSGTTLGAIIGRLVAQEIVGGDNSPMLEKLRP
jgi:glycine/D-amino acid oxidase-like deaminating enzyme